MDPLCHLQGGPCHELAALDDSAHWKSPLNPDLSRERIQAVVARLLQADGQAFLDLSKGLRVISRVRSAAPNPDSIASDSPSLSAFRAFRMTGGELIRPMLLIEPDLSPLRSFQVDGVRWLLDHPKAILADDMGLGKTIQSIYALRMLFNEGKAQSALVICPKSLLANWEHELTKWAPELGRVRLVPRASIREQAWAALLSSRHILLTNYEQVRNPTKVLQEIGPDVVIADEAHRIRNISSQVAQGIRRIRADRLWALTGTPVERDPEDLATILSVLEPSRFSVRDKSLHIASLRSQARPYVLRRLSPKY